MRIPEPIREQLRAAGKEAGKVGVELSKEFLNDAKALIAGVYLMPPFQKYHVVDEVLSVL